MTNKETIKDIKKDFDTFNLYLQMVKLNAFTKEYTNKIVTELYENDKVIEEVIKHTDTLGLFSKNEIEIYLKVKKRIELAKDWNDEFVKTMENNNQKTELSNIEIIQKQLDFLERISKFSGKFFSDEWVLKQAEDIRKRQEEKEIPRSDVLDAISLLIDDPFILREVLKLSQDEINYILNKKGDY